MPILLFAIWSGLANSLIVNLILCIFPIVAMCILIYAKNVPLIFKIVWCAVFGLLPLCIILFTMSAPAYDFCFLRYILPFLFVGLSLLALLVPNFTKNQLSMRGKVLGFRRFLQRVELKVLERLVQDDPEYYFNILPFCYVLGLTKIMQQKFAALQIEPPTYCMGYDPVIFGALMLNSFRITILPPVSSRGGRWGGGYSGGGGGFGGSFGGGGGGGGMRGR